VSRGPLPASPGRASCGIILTMKTRVTIDDDVYEAAQAHAQATGKRLGRALSERVSRFPVFEVPVNARAERRTQHPF